VRLVEPLDLRGTEGGVGGILDPCLELRPRPVLDGSLVCTEGRCRDRNRDKR
jgi:hypothetical protein